MASTKVTSAELSINRAVDANGWVVYDFGSYKQYRKGGATGYTIAGGSWTGITYSSNLPVGMSTIGGNFLEGTAYSGDAAVTATIGATGGSSSILGSITNQYTGSVSNFIYWSICITQ